MNLPNKLTVLRLIMIPVFVACYYITAIPANFYIASGIFLLATITDFLDGYIARKYNMVTDFGKFLDPVADKVLVSTALVLLLVPPQGIIVVPWYASIFVAVIIARELIISGFRMVVAGKGVVLAAEKSGKLKTFFTDISLILLIVSAGVAPQEEINTVNIVGVILLGFAVLLTIISGLEIIIKNIFIFKGDK